jgi:hypothetical protein
MKISEVENIFKELFEAEKGLVKTVETVYEKSKNEEFYKLVISIHDLRVQDTLIIHTKFIFKTDLEKNNIIEDAFMYLYDINCIYHTKHFSDAFDLKKKVKHIVDANKFGKDIQTLSEFIDTPGVLISHYFRENHISNYSIGNVTYEPKFKIKPCEETTFDFVINVLNAGNDYNIALCISKTKSEDNKEKYKFRFRLLENIETVEVDKLLNIHFLIGNKIVEMLDKILK